MARGFRTSTSPRNKGKARGASAKSTSTKARSTTAAGRRPRSRINVFVLGLCLVTVVFVSSRSRPDLFNMEVQNSSQVRSNGNPSTERQKGSVVDATTSTQTELSSADKIVVTPILKSAVKKSSGDGWSSSIVRSFEEGIKDSKFSCQWAQFEAAGSGKTAEFCTHPFPEGVSEAIRTTKRWHHCNVLPELWNKATKKENSIYVEIGANIGSCVFEMLLSTDANIVAFEPHPMNYFNVMSTVTKLGPEYQKRLVLFPVGLGDATVKSTIFSGANNMGNSNIGTMVKDARRQAAPSNLQFDVYVERLQDLLDPTKIHVPLIKMDAQGFECKILEGMGAAVASVIHIVKFEWAQKWLDGQQCTDLLPRFRKFGFEILHNGGLVTADTPPRRFCELIATKKK